MKITKDKCELKLEVNIELSNKFKEDFEHKPKHCYDNSYNLLQRGLIDTYVIGWVIVGTHDGKEVPFPVRHGFGIKDGKIIDSTLYSDMLPVTRYFTMLELTNDDMFNIWKEYEEKGKHMYVCLEGYVGFDVENRIQLELYKEMGINVQ